MRFHAAPPVEQWVNDPVGLVSWDGVWRLFVQHRADPPKYKETGWGLFTSHDLRIWKWDGEVLPPTAAGWAYSGSVVAYDGELRAYHTRHHGCLEKQCLSVSRDGGLTWTDADCRVPGMACGANRRDPFVRRLADGSWAMLLAHPADWNDWQAGPCSELHRYTSADGSNWAHAGLVERCAEPGLLWEMPVSVEVEGRLFLMVSEVDRRSNGATGRVLVRDAAKPGCWSALDHGPDFYAAIPASPASAEMIVGWGSSWQTARRMTWGGFAGGPISLPRHLAVTADDQLGLRPLQGLTSGWVRDQTRALEAGVAEVSIDGAAPFRIVITSGAAEVVVAGEPAKGAYRASRSASDPAFEWAGAGYGLAQTSARHLTLAVDGRLVELFDTSSALAWTFAVPGSAPIAVRLECGGRQQNLAWLAPPF